MHIRNKSLGVVLSIILIIIQSLYNIIYKLFATFFSKDVI